MSEVEIQQRTPFAVGDVAAIASIVGLLAFITIEGRGLWFFSDDWNILADYHGGNLLEPFNNHLSLVPAGIYAALFHSAGLGDYLPYRLVGVAGMGLLGVAVWRYARGRVGPWAGALATTAVIWGSGGATNLMFPFLVNFSLPIASLVAAWIALDSDRSRRDLLAAAALAVALATSGLGVLVGVALAVELALRRAPWRRWLPAALVGALWFAWYLQHRVSTGGAFSARATAAYALRMLWGGTTALAAGWKPGGIVVAVGLVTYFAFAATRWRSVDPRVLGALSAPVAFAALTAYTRLGVVPAIPPDEFRYRWTIAAFVVLAVVSAWRRPDSLCWPTPAAATVFATLSLVVAIGAALVARDATRWAEMVERAAPGLRAELYAAEAVGNRVDSDHVLPLSYVPVTLGSYLGAVADVGSPLDGHNPADFGGSADHRRSADRLLSMLPPRDDAEVPSDCAASSETTVVVQPGSTIRLDVSSRPEVTMSRFGDTPVAVDWALPDGDGWQIRVPADTRQRRGAPAYRLRISAVADGDTLGVVVCRPGTR